MAHVRQSRPDSGASFQAKVLNTLSCFFFARQRPGERSCCEARVACLLACSTWGFKLREACESVACLEGLGFRAVGLRMWQICVAGLLDSILSRSGFGVSTVTQGNRGSTFALRRPTLDFCPGGQRNWRIWELELKVEGSGVRGVTGGFGGSSSGMKGLDLAAALRNVACLQGLEFGGVGLKSLGVGSKMIGLRRRFACLEGLRVKGFGV